MSTQKKLILAAAALAGITVGTVSTLLVRKAIAKKRGEHAAIED